MLSPLYVVVPRPVSARERRLHLGVGQQGKLATLDNALSHHAALVPERPMAVGIMRRVWVEVRQWKTCFEKHGADGQLIDQLTRAFRDLSDIASPELEAEIRRGAPQTSPISTAMVGEARADEALLPGMGRLPAG